MFPSGYFEGSSPISDPNNTRPAPVRVWPELYESAGEEPEVGQDEDDVEEDQRRVVPDTQTLYFSPCTN